MSSQHISSSSDPTAPSQLVSAQNKLAAFPFETFPAGHLNPKHVCFGRQQLSLVHIWAGQSQSFATVFDTMLAGHGKLLQDPLFTQHTGSSLSAHVVLAQKIVAALSLLTLVLGHE
jgi:hypothetical protein